MIADAVEAACRLHIIDRRRDVPELIAKTAVLTASVGWKHELIAVFPRAPSETRSDQFAYDYANAPPLAVHMALSEIVSLGVKPFLAPNETRIREDQAKWVLSHPINLAAMFARCLKDRTTGQMILDAYPAIEKAYELALNDRSGSRKQHPDFIDYAFPNLQNDRWFWIPAWGTPRPEACGLTLKTPFDANIALTNASMSAYLDTAQIKVALQSGFSQACAAAATGGPELEQIMVEYATKKLMTTFTDGVQPDLELLASYLRVVPRWIAEKVLDDAKGVRTTLCICRRDTRPESMKAGLITLSSLPGIKNASTLYGRAPTEEELLILRPKALLNVLYHMPLSILNEVLDGRGVLEKLRARLFSEMDKDPDKIRVCLAPHNDRRTLAAYPFDPSSVTTRDGLTGADWDRVYGGLARTYLDSKRFRREIRNLLPNHPATRLVAAEWCITRARLRPGVLEVLAYHPHFEEMKTLIDSVYAPTVETSELVQRSLSGPGPARR